MTDDAESQDTYADEAQIETLVRGFESCSVEDFNHGSHLVVALWYLVRLPEAEAFDRMRAGLRRFAAHHNSNLYHETITIFWLKQVQDFRARAVSHRPLHELANQLLASLPDTRLVFDYYSPELLWSDAAKNSWVEPDLKRMKDEK
ncbi:MAG: hypothetical protein QOF61_2307 [Acidobacteriota bacterium]|jgi:hypothetical protein|nr:hypothetical protein [Acidobacteriota bacterium]